MARTSASRRSPATSPTSPLRVELLRLSERGASISTVTRKLEVELPAVDNDVADVIDAVSAVSELWRRIVRDGANGDLRL